MDRITRKRARSGSVVLEDAAQSAARYKGKRVASIGVFGIFVPDFKTITRERVGPC